MDCNNMGEKIGIRPAAIIIKDNNILLVKPVYGSELFIYCRGCRAGAYAVTGDYMAKDPMCFKQFIKDEEKEPRVIRR